MYLSSVWNHPYSKHLPYAFSLLIRDAGFPYTPVRPIDGQRVEEDCPWLKGRLLYEDELLQLKPYRYRNAEVAKKNWSTTAKQVKGLLQKHGVADMPVSIDYANIYLIDALREEGLTVVDGCSWIDECGMVKFDEEVVCMKAWKSLFIIQMDLKKQVRDLEEERRAGVLTI